MNNTKKITASSVCLALCIFLPFFTGNIPHIGKMLCPMHIPVLLCGFICGKRHGALVGFIGPLLRGALFSVPVLFPNGIAMAFELAAYGFFAGLFYNIFPKNIFGIYVSLLISMIIGRIVWGIATAFMIDFSFALFINGAIVTSLPGILVQLVLIPAVVYSVHKSQEYGNM